MKRIHFSVALGLFFTAVPVCGQAFELQHFQCYSVRQIDPEVVTRVGLVDQFGTAEEMVDVRRAKRFCNPAAKFHPGIPNPFFPITDDRQHLMFYSTFPQSEPLRVVELDNQFGRQTLLLREAVALAVPTEKRIPGPHPFPLGLDHFRCYGAWGAFANTSVWLSDQFIAPFTGHFVLNPVSFCNPVQKRDVTGGVTPIQHPELHLTCYSWTTPGMCPPATSSGRRPSRLVSRIDSASPRSR